MKGKESKVSAYVLRREGIEGRGTKFLLSTLTPSIKVEGIYLGNFKYFWLKFRGEKWTITKEELL